MNIDQWSEVRRNFNMREGCNGVACTLEKPNGSGMSRLMRLPDQSKTVSAQGIRISHASQHHVPSQNHLSTEGTFEEGRKYTTKTDSSSPIQREARARAATNNRLRKARIAEGIKTLQNCLPFSDQDNKESVLDDVIDYMKFLKLQLKVLGQSRLNGEDSKHPFVFVEGYGHYLLDENFTGEPLEEIMGQLIESNTQVALDLLGSKGLTILPMDLANCLIQTD